MFERLKQTIRDLAAQTERRYKTQKIQDEFTGMCRGDGTPMSRQEIHMLRKRKKNICLSCGEPALGVYCLKHTIAARERERQKSTYAKKIKNAPSRVIEQQLAGRGRQRRRVSKILLHANINVIREQFRSNPYVKKFHTKVSESQQ